MTASRDFLPVIDRPLDNTAMSAYMTCPREYYFSMVLHRRSKGKAPPLVFGSAWHKAMEIHYKSGGDRELVRYAVQAWWDLNGHHEPDDYRTMQRVLLDYDRYVKQYGADPAKEEGQTLGSAGEWMVEMATNAQSDDLLHPWAGKLDRVIEMLGLVYPEDHKTTSRLDKHYWRQFDLSNQMMGYVKLGKTLLPSMPVVGVRINLSHVLTADTKFYRQTFTFSPPMLERWANVMNVWMKRLAADYAAIHEYVATQGDDRLPSIPPDDIFVQHFGDNACSRKFGMCQYHQVCSSSPRAQAGVLEREYDINPWNPLEEADAAVE